MTRRILRHSSMASSSAVRDSEEARTLYIGRSRVRTEASGGQQAAACPYSGEVQGSRCKRSEAGGWRLEAGGRSGMNGPVGGWSLRNPC
ncbi:hypothetical protein Mp_1g15810 [Marchantia polymorpha subsp. ruderalis]|uniref:Uncharacterized protein n=2 Tax=Marchantia polymorpha TaxID=3197 RepID=A0AAF6AQL5_MARPO|nr:hypothetical protein MARPO_0033s0080 [Marchantia polymorpha]BBM98735.1 hypothetical protein Mp_1g15810 [Marchantia polymorpha subsp. ruderalis]|eukprot:PTQ41671.1 hypothetical protein MARPO_0033s0080 [Marchantia polymorpha]